MPKMKTMYAAVHKAAITLMDGETIAQFTKALKEAGSKYLSTKLNLGQKDDVWCVEVFANKAVFDVYKAATTGQTPSASSSKYYAVDYKRDKGEFAFGDVMEVQRVTQFKPKPGVAVKKALVDVSKPYPNEHAARLTDPKQYKSFARSAPKGFPAGVEAIYGIKSVGGKDVSEIQAIRFDAKSWTVAKAKAWLKKNKFKVMTFEKASGPVKKTEKHLAVFGDWVQTEKDFWNSVI